MATTLSGPHRMGRTGSKAKALRQTEKSGSRKITPIHIMDALDGVRNVSHERIVAAVEKVFRDRTRPRA